MTPHAVRLMGATLLAGTIAATLEAMHWRLAAWAFCVTQVWFLLFAIASMVGE